MEKKYKLTDEIIYFEGCKLHRIEALKDFFNVRVSFQAESIRELQNTLNRY